jgi:hypothetical protein
VASQAVVHMVPLQAVPVGQSVTVLQPQAPPMHCAPSEPPQVLQLAPVAPQAAGALPATQLVPSQQPPLHTSPLAQLVEQVCDDRLQAVPLGQSPGTLQPHTPPVQA